MKNTNTAKMRRHATEKGFFSAPSRLGGEFFAPTAQRRLTALRTKLYRAYAVRPDRAGWTWCALVFLGFVLFVVPLGFGIGFFRFGLADMTGAKLALFPVLVLVKPCLFEETVFRVLLLPAPERDLPRGRRLLAGAAALAVFVGAHPLNGLTLTPAAWGVFTHPFFLYAATLLGLACTLVYLKTRSIWPAVLVHWIAVVAWIGVLGGKQWLTGAPR